MNAHEKDFELTETVDSPGKVAETATPVAPAAEIETQDAAPDLDSVTPEVAPEADAYTRALAFERRRARDAEKRLRDAEAESARARAELENERRTVATVQAAHDLDLPAEVVALFPPEMPMDARHEILAAIAQLVMKGVRAQVDVLMTNKTPEVSTRSPYNDPPSPPANRSIPKY